MRTGTAQQYGWPFGLAAALTIFLLAPSPTMAQTGEADELPARTAEETAADLQIVLDRHLTESRCENPDTQLMRSFEPIVARLSETAILYAIPCTAGAYNIAYRLYMRETGEIGGVETLYFATWLGEYGWGGTDLLYNIDVDGPRLSAFYKGRGLGDCGTDARWIWRDYAYRLVRFAAQDDCNGVTAENWPVLFAYPGGSMDGSAK
ncbi:MAG TPA: DUF1176 domain-containing protein [Afifellaceae bacterium]|nr:DUF1176 domain-containing protein [Afifellaceae bacterium]